MEILMKLKCSPSAPGSAAHSTLKVVDHHHQLAQQHALCPPPSQPPPSPHNLMRVPTHPNAGLTLHHHSSSPLPPPQPAVPMSAACLDYSNTPMDCCSAAAQQEMLEWEQQRRNRFDSTMPSSYCSATTPGIYEPPACCSGIAYSTPPPPVSLPPLQQAPALPPTVSTDPLLTNSATVDLNMHYEYHEPEENFVSIDDAKIKGFLMKIGQAQALKEKQEQASKEIVAKSVNEQQVVYEIIDLDDEDDREELRQIKKRVESETKRYAESQQPVQQVIQNPPKQMKSPSISLIPKSPPREAELSQQTKSETSATKAINASKERIIAQIDLSDSSDDEEVNNKKDEKLADEVRLEKNEMLQSAVDDDDDDDEDLPLAAAAVSCELECDDDDDEDEREDVNSNNEIVILQSDDENVEFIEKHEEGQELRWDELEEAKERNFFECFLCGKKVQSSYNLRRHMMIHTGERPFGCDMCDRRFREFSDLKKHRRRHANDANFVCMVCRVNTPMVHDPTRCSACDTKSGAMTAAMCSQGANSPEKSQTPPPLLKALKPPSRNITPAPITTTNTTNGTPSNTAPSSPAFNIVKINSPTAAGSTISQADVPTLVPINASATASAQLLLDNIPAVHRPSYNQLGVITRKEFPCPLCQRPFGTRHNLKRHFMIHTGEKPFSCAKCRKPFREYSTLKKHMVTHQRDRFYKCLRCPRKYRDYLEYNQHKKTHSDEGEGSTVQSTSSCSSSPKKKAKFSSGYDDYDTNDEDSSSEDWLECCECQQRFTDIETYTEHLKEHDPGLYLYECYICKKSFEQRDELVEHVTICKEELRETALEKVSKN